MTPAAPGFVLGEGRGVLEIRNLEAAIDLDLRTRNMRGQWVKVDFLDTTPPTFRAEIAAGHYRLRATRESEPGPRTYELRVAPGAMVVVDLAAASTPDLFPLSPGLGRLDVEVTGTRERPLHQVAVLLTGRDGELGARTTTSGRVRFDVMPGRYTVTAGALAKTVSIQSGRKLVLRLDGRATGEIDLDGGINGTYVEAL
ncbi:MAG: hypothetical protein V3T86_09180, partial [Planctomycetota bacterium]